MNHDKICSIYLLTNIVNGKIYIGQTWYPLSIRMGKDGCNYKNCLYLYSAIQKYGSDKFQYEILIQCCKQECADYLEEYFIDQYNSRNHQIGYNIKGGGSIGKHSETTKSKISKTLKNREKSSEALFQISELGRMWKGKKRVPQSEEIIQHHVAAMKEWHDKNEHPMLGKHLSEKSKIKISVSNKGKHTMSDAHKAKVIEATKMSVNIEQAILQAYQKGDTIANIEEQFATCRSSIYRILKRNNISIERDHKIWSGKQHSEETKQKMAEARKKYWATKHNQEKPKSN